MAAATKIAKPDRKMVLLVAKLNAAPLLNLSSNLKKVPIISFGPSIKNFTAIALVK